MFKYFELNNFFNELSSANQRYQPGLVLSIVGLVKAKDYNGDGKGLAIAGIVICAVVMVLGIILYIILMAAGTATGDWTEVINEMENITPTKR